MKASILQSALATLVLVAFSGCQSGWSAPRWDWWRGASNDVAPPSSALAGSPAAATLPSETAQPQVTLPGENSTYANLGTPASATTSPSSSQASYTAAGGYPGTPYPNTNYPAYAANGSTSGNGSPVASASTTTPYPGAVASYAGSSSSTTSPVANYGSGSSAGTPSVGAQVGPYVSPSGGIATPDYASRYGQPAASAATAAVAPYTDVIPPVTQTGSTTVPPAASASGSTSYSSPAQGSPSAGSTVGPRYASVAPAPSEAGTRYDNGASVGGVDTRSALPGAGNVAPSSTYVPGATGYKPGESSFNPANVPPYTTPAYQVPGSDVATPDAAAATHSTTQPATSAPVSPAPFRPAGTSTYTPNTPATSSAPATSASYPAAAGSYPTTGYPVSNP